MEATGRMERNWLDLLEQIADKTEPEVYCAGPLILRRFAEQRLHAGKTDRTGAQLMADYLRFGGVETDSEGDGKSPHPGLRTLSRRTKELIGRATQPKKRAACSWRAHPELAQHVRGHMSQWVLKLIKQHPTPEEVVESEAETVAEIPHVTEERAQEAIGNARSSVAGQTDPDTGPALSMVAEDLRIEIPARTETCRLRSPNEKLLKGRSYSKEEGPHAHRRTVAPRIVVRGPSHDYFTELRTLDQT